MNVDFDHQTLTEIPQCRFVNALKAQVHINKPYLELLVFQCQRLNQFTWERYWETKQRNSFVYYSVRLSWKQIWCSYRHNLCSANRRSPQFCSRYHCCYVWCVNWAYHCLLSLALQLQLNLNYRRLMHSYVRAMRNSHTDLKTLSSHNSTHNRFCLC